jgi:hypothetical protein
VVALIALVACWLSMGGSFNSPGGGSTQLVTAEEPVQMHQR